MTTLEYGVFTIGETIAIVLAITVLLGNLVLAARHPR